MKISAKLVIRPNAGVGVYLEIVVCTVPGRNKLKFLFAPLKYRLIVFDYDMNTETSAESS